MRLYINFFLFCSFCVWHPGSKTWQLGPKLCLLKTVLVGFFELGSWFISGQCVEVVFGQFL